MSAINIEIRNDITLHGMPGTLTRTIKAELTFNNPMYENAIQHNRTTRGISRKIRTYIENAGILHVPRGYENRLRELILLKNLPASYTYKTALFDPEFPPKKIDLWDYQKPWLKGLLSATQGIGVSPPGSGKTIIGLAAYAHLGQPCLWVTHTGRLVRQTRKKAEEFLGVKTGIIGKGEVDIKHFTVGMVQTLVRRNLEEYRDKFGLIILDECFPAGTPIDGRPIETLKVGDSIRSFNEWTNTLDKRPIVRLYKGRVKSLIRLTMSSGKIIICTPGHPFWTRSGWKRAGTLTFNDEVLDYGSQTRLRPGLHSVWVGMDSVEVLEPGSDGRFGGVCSDGYVYNVEVEKNHTYLANGMVVHNCHHLPAVSFNEVISAFDAHYRYGLTATPYRDDKLEQLMFQVMGPTLATIDKKTLRNKGKLMTPAVIRRPTKFNFPYNPMSRKFNYIALDSALAKNPQRNRQISTDVIVEASLSENNICIVLVGRLSHGEALFDLLSPILPGVGFVHSKMSYKKSDQILDDFESGKLQILIATYKMLSEGFDYQPANRLFLTGSFKARSRIEQACGRIERTFPGKTDARVYDYVDTLVGVLNRQAEIRLDIFEINDMSVITVGSSI